MNNPQGGTGVVIVNQSERHDFVVTEAESRVIIEVVDRDGQNVQRCSAHRQVERRPREQV